MPSLTLPLSDIVLQSDIQLRLDNLLRDLSIQISARTIALLTEEVEQGDTDSLENVTARRRLDRLERSVGELHWSGWRLTGSGGIEDSKPVSSNDDPPSDLVEGCTDCWMSRASGEPHELNPVLEVAITLTRGRGSIKVTAPREHLAEFADSIRELLADYVVTPPHTMTEYSHPPFRVFIAYGGGHAWEVVRDYLRAEGFDVTAFTEEERASQLTLNVVSDMIRSASVAVIVMTGADQDESGGFRSRQNVVHEAGFAQGSLGIEQTIILREAGVVLPTNLDGLTYIPFGQNEIHRTKERVLARVRALEVRSMGGC